MIIISTSEEFIYKENKKKKNFIYPIKENLRLICFGHKICFAIDLFKNKIIIEKNIALIYLVVIKENKFFPLLR